MDNQNSTLDRFADRIALFLFEVAINLMTPRRRIAASVAMLQMVRKVYGIDPSAVATAEPAE